MMSQADYAQDDSSSVNETWYFLSNGAVDNRTTLAEKADSTGISLTIEENYIIISVSNFESDSIFSLARCGHMQFYFEGLRNDSIIDLGNNNYCDYEGNPTQIGIAPMEKITTHTWRSEQVTGAPLIRVRFHFGEKVFYSEWIEV